MKYIQNKIILKTNSLYSLSNKNSRDSSLHDVAFLCHFRGFPGTPWDSLGFPATINRSQGISQFVQDQGL